MSDHGKEQFLNEVKLIKSLQHRNLVRIIGCSVEGDNDARFLVYEYLSNLSLDKHLFSKTAFFTSDGAQRLICCKMFWIPIVLLFCNMPDLYFLVLHISIPSSAQHTCTIFNTSFQYLISTRTSYFIS